MRSKTQDKLLSILLKALKPFVHLLLESGIGHREFSEIAKRAFVDVATKNYGIRGRDTNISRVAVMTGLTRKEVKRIREGSFGIEESGRIKPIPASVVLHGWYTESEFLNGDGLPRPLPFLGDNNSFATLVKRFAGDIPPGALRTELVRAGAVVVDDAGLLKAVRREFRLVDQEDRLTRAFERPLGGMLSNIARNNLVFHKSSKDHATTWPERIIEIQDVDPRYVDRVRELIENEITSYSAFLDDKLKEYEDTAVNDDQKGSKGVSVSVGQYYFER